MWQFIGIIFLCTRLSSKCVCLCANRAQRLRGPSGGPPLPVLLVDHGAGGHRGLRVIVLRCGTISLCPSPPPPQRSAPDIAGTDMANPLAMILSASMMLKYDLARPDEAVLLERAVEAVLDAGLRTTDIFQVAAAVAALAHPPPHTHTHAFTQAPTAHLRYTRVVHQPPHTHNTHTHHAHMHFHVTRALFSH